MKHRKNFFLLLIALIALGGAGVFSWNFSRQASDFSAAEPQSMDSPSSDLAAVTAPESPPEISPIPSVSAASSAGTPAPAASSAPVAPAFIKRTLTEEWIDSPLKLAGRQRIRIVEVDFKYPYLRLEESITLDPQTGIEKVTLLRSSVADHLMIGIARGSNLDATRKVLEENGYQIRAVEPDSYILAELEDFTQVSAQSKAIEELQGLNDFIDFAEPDYIVHPCISPNDPAYTSGKLWGLHNPGTTAGSKADADIDAYEAWQVRTDASNIVVAVTDTGIQYNHEDLIGNMWRHPSTNAFGFDAYDDDNDPMDVGGHGTHCAGTIGASGNNAKGMTGVAWNVQLMGVRFLGPNGGSTSDAIRVVNYSRLNGAHIISASWGGGGFSQGLFNAIEACQEADIPFIAAAGNSSTNNDSTPHYPSSYNLPNIVSVASTTNADKLSPFSCYGRYSVDIGAPGSDIWSSYIGSNQTYKYLNGTSMATPHVSGALALAMAHYPDESAEQIIERLYKSADRIPALAGKVSTGARLNLHAMLQTVTPQKSSDLFAEAYRFEGSYGVWSGTSKGATREPDEDAFSVPGSGDNSIWFAFHSGNGGLVTLDAYSNFLGYRMLVFEGSEKGSLQLLHDVTNDFGFLNAGLKFESKPNTEYRIALDDSRPDGQLYSLNYSRIGPNDYFRSATVVSGDSFSVPGTNRGATPEAFEQTRPHAGVGRGKTVWWRWTAPASFDFTINTLGSGFDTVLAVYTGQNPYDLTEIGSNDDRNALDWTSQVSFAAVAGTTYHIVVDGFRDDAAGEIVLNGFRSGQLTILRQPTSLQAEIGKRAVFDISVQTGGQPQYQWFFNDEAIPGQTSANLVIDPIATTHFGNYKVQVWNSENSLTSQVVTLSEKLTAPTLVWSSGNQAVALATPVTLSAQFSGSAPITYTWTKNGNPHAGSESSLNFPSATVGDSGTYRLTATNAAGTAYVDFSLSVVSSPWDRWEWRRQGVPNAAITDIKVYGTMAYALAGNIILRSSDGVSWSKSLFPQNFTAKSMAKVGNLFVCLGHALDSSIRFATSADGISWTVSSPSGSTWSGISNFSEYKLSSFKTHFIATGPSGVSGGALFRSTDGIAWTRIQATNIGGSVTNLTATGQPATDGNTLLLASSTSPTSGNIRFYKTTNGTTWQEFEVTPTGGTHSSLTPHSAAYFLGKFHLFASHRIMTSADTLSWSRLDAASNGIASTSMFTEAGGIAYAFQPGQTYQYFSDLAVRTRKSIYPSGSQNFSAVATLGDSLIFGTDEGLLRLASNVAGISIPTEKVAPLASINFEDGIFVARAQDDNYDKFPPSLTSGDGIAWKTAYSMDNPNVAYAGRAYGRYWGRSTGYTATHVHMGYTPFDIRPVENSAPGLGTNLLFIAEAANASALAISSASPTSSTFLLHRRANATASWTAMTYPVAVGGDLRFANIDNRWFSFSTEGWTAKLIYTNSSGTTWTSTGITGSNAVFVKHSGAIYCYYQTGGFTALRMRKSTDGGSNWAAAVTATGVPAVDHQIFVNRIVSFGEYLVLLSNHQRLYYSLDGVSWIEGSTPTPITRIAVGQGKLVGCTANGGLLETGPIHAGVNAPLVRILSPLPTSTHIMSTQVVIEGTISDPEDGAASYQAFLDGNLVASGSGTQFRFPISTSSLTGHTLSVVATDSQGLKQMDAIRLKTTLPEPDNLLRDAEGKTFIPTQHTTVLDGVFYVAAARSLYRSIDGVSWERVPIPGLANPIYGIAAGNGSLVVQFDNGGIITTRDGVNWTHFQPNQTDYWLRTPVRYSEGFFTAAYQNPGSTTGSVMVSFDGLSWRAGSVSEDGYLNWVARNPVGTLIGMRGYGGGVVRSIDSGSNWQMIAEFPAVIGQSSQGFFVNGKFVVLENSHSRIRTSSDSYVWSTHAAPTGISTNPLLSLVQETLFLGTSTTALYTSRNGSDWQPTSHPLRHAGLSYARGVFLAVSGNSLVRSADGVSWTVVPTPFLATNISRILGNDSVHLVIDNKGATWTSTDTESWVAHLPGATLPSFDGRLGREIVKLGNRLIVGGAVFQKSDDDGLTWTGLKLNGVPVTNPSIGRVVSNNTVVIANTKSDNRIIRSIDGENFSTVASLPTKTWADLSWNGTEWMLLAKDGVLYRSSDDGLSWSAVTATASLKKGGAITWFNNRWVIIGSDDATFNSPYTCFNLTAAGVFTKHSAIGFYNSVSDVRTLIAHGKLIIWEQGEFPFVSTTGNTWTQANVNAGAGNNDFDIYYTTDGFVAFVGALSSAYPVVAWKSGTDGVTWSSIPAPFNSISEAHNLGDRLFVFAAGSISEIHPYDVALTLPASAPVSLGVGDQIQQTVSIRNNGITLPVGSKWVVHAWLSGTRFFRDGKNVPVGSFEIAEAMPAAGTSKNITLSYTLPNDIPTGNNYLILSLVSLGGVKERNTPNNTVISDTAAITIPEWEFSVATNGNGQVNRDFAAMRYPHNARVSLTATAGKGAIFTGWAGDAYSPNNQITILMDGNKSLQANFSNRASLQVYVRGFGEVNGVADLGSYELNQNASLTAVPASGWTFSHWSGGSTQTTANTTIVMDQSKAVTAHFVQTLAAWKSSHFNAAQLLDAQISGDDADPDHDGLRNWQEHLHSSHPLNRNSTGVISRELDATFYRCVYQRNTGAPLGSSLLMQAGRNLNDWNSPELEERILSTQNGVETVEARLPRGSHTRGFFRFFYQRAAP